MKFVLSILLGILILDISLSTQVSAPLPYTKGFEAAGTYERFEREDADALGLQIRSFMKHELPDLTDPRFTILEKDHMHDVRNLMDIGQNVGRVIICILLIAALWAIAHPSQRMLMTISSILRNTGSILLALVALVALFALSNFSSAFDRFHQIFFSGNWQFSNQSLLIQLFPQAYFEHAAMQVGMHMIITALIMIAMSELCRRRLYVYSS